MGTGDISLTLASLPAFLSDTRAWGTGLEGWGTPQGSPAPFCSSAGRLPLRLPFPLFSVTRAWQGQGLLGRKCLFFQAPISGPVCWGPDNPPGQPGRTWQGERLEMGEELFLALFQVALFLPVWVGVGLENRRLCTGERPPSAAQGSWRPSRPTCLPLEPWPPQPGTWVSIP